MTGAAAIVLGFIASWIAFEIWRRVTAEPAPVLDYAARRFDAGKVKPAQLVRASAPPPE